MSEVFISYARSTEERAMKVEEGLRGAGFAVWRDSELPAHRSYAEVIEERLRGAKAVVVLWSSEAASSHWVRAEADTARELGTLVQASVDGGIAPMPFNQFQCADLKDWDGDDGHRGWTKLVDSVESLAGKRQAEAPKSLKAAGRRAAICILPFANMSGDAEQEYFSDGISEDITTDLSKVSALEVTARNTAFTFKGRSVNVCEVANQLGVSHVLEGSVRKAGNRVRITAQLIDGATGGHVWADRYDRDLDDVFAIQDEISEAIVAALKVKLLPEEKKAIEQRGTTNVEAYKLYLMARQYWTTGNHGDSRREERVMRICGRAVQIDPYYAQAWALLAIAQSNLRYGFGRDIDDGFAAAHTALSIDPTIAEAHCVMSRRLQELDRFDEAQSELEKGIALEPDSWDVNKALANFHMWTGNIAKAVDYYEKAAAVAEWDYHSWGMLQTCYESLGAGDKALHAAKMTLEMCEKVLGSDPSNGAAISFAVSALALQGEQTRAREWIDRALLIDPDNLNMRYNFACALAKYLGDSDAAVRMLEYTLSHAKGSLGNVEFDPDLESIRDDPRFQSALKQAKERLGYRSKQSEAEGAKVNPAGDAERPRS